jgi:transcriptional regulator with XRE-family HTH domain
MVYFRKLGATERLAVNVGLMIKQRLQELGLEQKDLATAAGVTDSYISQLVARKKLPPFPDRTDIYAKMEKFLRLPSAKLAALAAHERAAELKKKLPESPVPLYQDVRQLILRKCVTEKEPEIRSIFERHPFGELERLVTQKLLDVVKKVAKQELESESWLKLVAELNGRSYEEMRVSILEFLEADVFNISTEHCMSFLDPLIDSWDIDLTGFGMEIVLNRRLSTTYLKKLEFVEKEVDVPFEEEPGLKEFCSNPAMSADAADEEIEFLKRLRFKGSRPTALYYYRELQNLRDPLNFREALVAPLHKYGDAAAVERQMQSHARRGAIDRWARNKRRQPAKKRK